MKLILSILALASIALHAPAQIVAPTNSPTTFFQSVESYFTEFNTNSTTFLLDRLEVSVGTATIGNSQLAADARVEFKFATNSAWSLDADIRNTTVAGTILSYQGGIGYSLVHYDTRITGYIDAGYKTDVNLPYIAPGILVKKALTPNTYAGVFMELPIYLRNSPIGGNQPVAPTYGVLAGFTF